MAHEETKDLVSACRDMKINVPVLFMNMATHDSDCPLCASVYAREARIKEKFAADYPELNQPVVYRCEMELQGMAMLEKLSAAMYQK
jgi:hypothetical protein